MPVSVMIGVLAREVGLSGRTELDRIGRLRWAGILLRRDWPSTDLTNCVEIRNL